MRGGPVRSEFSWWILVSHSAPAHDHFDATSTWYNNICEGSFSMFHPPVTSTSFVRENV